MENELLQSGSTAVGLIAIVALIIRELFAYLKSRKDVGNTVGDNLSTQILAELQKMNSNHLHTIQEVLENGNARLIDTIHNDNSRMIELLGEIKGNLNSRK